MKAVDQLLPIFVNSRYWKIPKPSLMSHYIDGFAFPIPKKHLHEYQKVAAKVAEIWKEYGAITYKEFVGDDMNLEGTKSFLEAIEVKDDEVVVFGWVVFPSKEIRIDANKKVPKDSRMTELVAPLMNPQNLIFDARKMVYGGFLPLVQS